VIFRNRVDIDQVPNTGAGDLDFVDIGIYEFSHEDTVVGPPETFRLQLDQNYPNPFNAQTMINFTIASSNWADLEIYDIAGQLVYSRKFTGMQPGPISTIWNGKDDSESG